MSTFLYILISLLISVFYLSMRILIRKRITFDASETYFISWSVTLILMLLELCGVLRGENLQPNYNTVAIYIFYMSIAAMVGYSISNLFHQQTSNKTIVLNINLISEILSKFKWILYLSFLVGLSQFAYLVVNGAWGTFEHYRIVAVTHNRSGIGAIIQQLSGHVSILATFYIIIFGLYQSLVGIKTKELFINIFLFSAINISIGGRAWITSATIPYLIAYFYGSAHQLTILKYNLLDRIKTNKKKLFTFCCVLISLFAIIGSLRGGSGFFTKFLYYTDGPKIANIVLEKYPPGSYELDYGKAQSGLFGGSKMHKQYLQSISDNIGLTVTVPSCIPHLYYDFGYWGGILFWFITSLLFGLISNYFIRTTRLFNILIYCAIARATFSTPIGSMFGYMIIVIEWIIILYFILKITGNGKYLNINLKQPSFYA